MHAVDSIESQSSHIGFMHDEPDRSECHACVYHSCAVRGARVPYNLRSTALRLYYGTEPHIAFAAV